MPMGTPSLMGEIELSSALGVSSSFRPILSLGPKIVSGEMQSCPKGSKFG